MGVRNRRNAGMANKYVHMPETTLECALELFQVDCQKHYKQKWEVTWGERSRASSTGRKNLNLKTNQTILKWWTSHYEGKIEPPVLFVFSIRDEDLVIFKQRSMKTRYMFTQVTLMIRSETTNGSRPSISSSKNGGLWHSNGPSYDCGKYDYLQKYPKMDTKGQSKNSTHRVQPSV